MLIAFLSRFVPGFEAACVRLRLNHGKTKDPLGDLKYLIDYYLQRGELERAEALSGAMVSLAEGDEVRWTDPECLPARKSLQYKRDSRKSQMLVGIALMMPLLIATQHQFILTGIAKYQIRQGHVAEAISLLRAEVAAESLLHTPNRDVALDLADALICDYQIGEASLLVKDILEQTPNFYRARYLHLQIAMLTGMSEDANQDARTLKHNLSKKELISALLMSNVLNGHGPFTELETMLAIADVDHALTAFKKIISSVPEEESNEQLCAAMGYYSKARHDDQLASRWFKQAVTILHHRRFRSDYVRYMDAAKNYVALVEHSKPIESRRLEWTAMGLAKQVGIRYETFEQKSLGDAISDQLPSLLQ